MYKFYTIFGILVFSLIWISTFPDASAIGISFGDSTYDVTDNAAVRVADTAADINPNLIDTISVKLKSTTDTTGILVTAYELDVDAGIFHVDCNFVTSGSSNSATNTLRVTQGDTIFAIYPAESIITFSQINSYTIPDAPTALTANAVSSSQIDLMWDAPPGTVAEYEIEGESPIGSGFFTLAVIPGNIGTIYSSKLGLQPDTQYNYRVSAINNYGTSNPSNEANAITYAETNSVILFTEGTAKLSKAVTKGTNLFNKGTYSISLDISADIDSVNSKGIPKLSNIAGTFSIDGANNSQDVTNQAFTKLKLTVSKDLKSIKWTAKEGSGELRFKTKLDFTAQTDKIGGKSKISKITIGKAKFAPKVTSSNIVYGPGSPARDLTGDWVGTMTLSSIDPWEDFRPNNCEYSGKVSLVLAQSGNHLGGTVTYTELVESTHNEICVANNVLLTSPHEMEANVFGSGFSGKYFGLDAKGGFTTDLLKADLSGTIKLGIVPLIEMHGQFTAHRVK